jgi:hypothetical protein
LSIRVRQRTATVLAEYHRDCELLGKLRQGRGCSGGKRAAAGIDDGKPAARNQCRRLLDQRGIGAQPRLLFGRRINQRHVGGRREHVMGDLEPHRLRAAAAQLLYGFAHQPGDLRRRCCLGLPLGHAAENAGLVAHLVKQPEALADRGRKDVSDDRKHGRIAGIGGGEPGHRVQQARPRHHHAGADPAGGAGVAIGHERGRLLVARHHVADVVADLAQPVHRPVELHAGNAEQVGHSLQNELAGQRLSSRQLHECVLGRLVLESVISKSCRLFGQGHGQSQNPSHRSPAFSSRRTAMWHSSRL